MGISPDPYLAYYKAVLGANVTLPLAGKVLLIGEKAKELEPDFAAAGFEVTQSGQSSELTRGSSTTCLSTCNTQANCAELYKTACRT